MRRVVTESSRLHQSAPGVIRQDRRATRGNLSVREKLLSARHVPCWNIL